MAFDRMRVIEVEAIRPGGTRRRMVSVFLAVVLFFAYAYLAISAPKGIFNSPDETANAYFATLFEKDEILHELEPLEGVARGRLHPRSVAVVEEFLVPGSFHGLPVLYGLLAKLFGLGFLPFMTPLVAVLAVFAWRRLVAHLSSDRAGDIAAFVLAVIPAWWYYANRGLYHNVLFTALLIFAAYFFIAKPLRAHLFQAENLLALKLRRLTTVFDSVLAGIAFGLALWVRTSEISWTVALAVVLLILRRKAIRVREIVACVVTTAIVFAPALVINDALYGSSLRTGYATNSVILGLSAQGGSPLKADAPQERASGGDSGIQSLDSRGVYPRENGGGNDNQLPVTGYRLLVTTLFPFGLHPRTALIHFTNFGIKLHWGVSIVLGASLLWFGYEFLRGRRSRDETILVALFAVVSAWLIAVYGSWVVRDNPDPNAVTIGISYSRYWLPIFVLASGIIGVAASQWVGRLRFRARTVVLVTGYGLLVTFSAHLAFFSQDDGLIAINKTLHGYAAVKADVLHRTTEESVIVVDRGDKIFFPDRRVVTPLRDEATYEILRPLSLRVPLYYYGITITEEDLRYHNEEKLLGKGLKLELVQTYDREALYRFVER